MATPGFGEIRSQMLSRLRKFLSVSADDTAAVIAICAGSSPIEAPTRPIGPSETGSAWTYSLRMVWACPRPVPAFTRAAG